MFINTNSVSPRGQRKCSEKLSLPLFDIEVQVALYVNGTASSGLRHVFFVLSRSHSHSEGHLSPSTSTVDPPSPEILFPLSGFTGRQFFGYRVYTPVGT